MKERKCLARGRAKAETRLVAFETVTRFQRVTDNAVASCRSCIGRRMKTVASIDCQRVSRENGKRGRMGVVFNIA